MRYRRDHVLYTVAALCARGLATPVLGNSAGEFTPLPPPLAPRPPTEWKALTAYPLSQTSGFRDIDDIKTSTCQKGPNATTMHRKRHVFDRRPCVSQAAKKLRLLHFHAQIVPVLYVHEDDARTMPLNLEHVVPASVLQASPNPEAVGDYSNCFLALRDINERRKNYRIAFDLEQQTVDALCTATKSKSVRHVGYGNCVDDARCLFYPRRADIAIVARTIRSMQRKWVFPLDAVTTASVVELTRLAASTPHSTKEVTQRLLLASVDHGLVGLK